MFWIAVWLGNYFINIFNRFAYPYGLYVFKKYKLKKSINFIKDEKTISKIIGYKNIVESLKPLIDMMKKQKETKSYTKNDGILFFGPPGCGKTNLVKTISYEAGIPMLTILAKDLITDRGTVGNLDMIFEVVGDYIARSGSCILFFDKLDFLVGNRENQQLDQNTKLILQSLLDKLGNDFGLKGLFIIACTNHKENIDQALLRPGRFGIHIAVDRPTREDIRLFCDAYEKKHNITIAQKDKLINQCMGMTVSEVLQKLRSLK